MWLRSAVILVALAIAGCQVRPLYLDAAQGGPLAPNADLRAIDVDPPTTRVGQVLRNEMLFLFRGDGSRGDEPRYRLRIIADTSTDSLAIAVRDELPAAVLVTLNGTFILSEIGTEKTLLTGSSTTTASYDFSSQRFANERAERDAETRAAKSMAENISARIAAYFVARQDS
ncbi:MAG: LPS assembly lipoprotein LptE [Pseudomonadota bacterium]